MPDLLAPDVALLAPVPEEYLIEAVDVIAANGRVAFGSRSWEVFRRLDALRKSAPVDVLLYASHARSHPGSRATWRGVYVGHVDGNNGAHPEGMRFRPPSTSRYREDNKEHWAVFLELSHVQPLPESAHVRTSDLRGLEKSKYFADGFVPEGPMLIERSGW
jgi:hypothetical protein